MEGGIPRHKSITMPVSVDSPAHSIMYERRPLKTLTLTPPDYKAPHLILSDSFIEKEIRFAGVVANIAVHLDCTNRTDVLRVIDRGKQEKLLPWALTYDHDAVFSINVHNVKIFKRDGNEELLRRLPIHEIAASCYIRDDNQHIMAIKFGSFKLSRGLALDDGQDLCQLAVMYCDTKNCAKELCSLIGQCFQMVYTDATMHFLDTKVNEAAAGLSIGSSTLRSDKSSANSTPKKDHVDQRNLGFLSQSSMDLDQVNGALSSLTTRSLQRTVTRRSSTTKSESDLSTTANEMIQDYVRKIYNKLNHDELRRFAVLVKAWHSTMAFTDFCEKVLELYGHERKHLLLGMKPFIPEKDVASFDAFLEKIGLAAGVYLWSETFTNNTSKVYRAYTGSMASSYAPTTVPSGNNDEYDQRLNEISHDIENLATSVDTGLNVELETPKIT